MDATFDLDVSHQLSGGGSSLVQVEVTSQLVVAQLEVGASAAQAGITRFEQQGSSLHV